MVHLPDDKLLTLHNQEFCNKEQLQLEIEEQNLTSKQISKCLIDEARGRIFKLTQAEVTNIICYKEIYFTLNNAVQQILDHFFVK